MKIIHTSDWHLGAKLRNDVSRLEDQEKFLRWLDETLEEERPDALLISGDVFDTHVPSNEAQALYYDFLARHLKDAGLRIIVTAGNHDSSSFLNAPNPLLTHLNVTVVGLASNDGRSEVVRLLDAEGRVGLVIAATPYMNEGELANFAPKPRPEEESLEQMRHAGFAAHYRSVLEEARKAANGAPIVLMGHATISGASLSDDDSEDSRRIGGVDSQPADAFSGADYVALGHLHVPQAVGKCETVRYSGTPLAMSFSEATQQKHVVVAEFGEKAGMPVRVRTVDIPAEEIGFVPLVNLKGTRDRLRQGLLALKEKGARTYVSVFVDEQATGISAFWEEIFDLCEGSGIRILVTERQKIQNGTQCPHAGESVRTQTPRSLAVEYIRSQVPDEDEAGKYIAALDEIL